MIQTKEQGIAPLSTLLSYVIFHFTLVAFPLPFHTNQHLRTPPTISSHRVSDTRESKTHILWKLHSLNHQTAIFSSAAASSAAAPPPPEGTPGQTQIDSTQDPPQSTVDST